MNPTHTETESRKVKSRCVHTVELKFFEDDANGEWGLAHKNTIDGDMGSDGFNAFYDATGIFHDVFEHWFERKHKYFMGDYAMNIGGEMAAMGAMWYYYSDLGVTDRDMNPQSIYSMSEKMRRSTQDLVTEAIGEGYCNFGNTLESNVPKQKQTEDYELEYQINELILAVKKYNRDRYNESSHDLVLNQSVIDERERNKEFGRAYKKSVTKSKVANLHRWGYNMAQKLVPHSWENRGVLTEFISFWRAFCKDNPAEEIANHLKGITFKLYRDSTGLISWKAFGQLKAGYGKTEVLITKHFTQDDLFDSEYAA